MQTFATATSAVLKLQNNIQKLTAEREQLSNEIWVLEHSNGVKFSKDQMLYLQACYDRAKGDIQRIDAKIKKCSDKLLRYCSRSID